MGRGAHCGNMLAWGQGQGRWARWCRRIASTFLLDSARTVTLAGHGRGRRVAERSPLGTEQCKSETMPTTATGAANAIHLPTEWRFDLFEHEPRVVERHRHGIGNL